MKNRFTQAALSLLVGGAILSAVAGGPEAPPMVTPGLYIGLGGAYDSYYTKSTYGATGDITNNLTNQSLTGVRVLSGNYAGAGNFSSNVTQDQFAPMVQIGYWAPIDSTWLWGLQASYKYTNYAYNTRLNAADQNFATQAFNANSTSNLTAPIQVAGGAASTLIPPSYFWLNQTSISPISNFNAVTHFNNELLLLAFFGVQFDKGYAYLGLGAVLFTYKDNYQLSTLWNLNDSNADISALNTYAVTGTNVVTTVNTSNVLQQTVLPNNFQSVIKTPIFLATSGPQSKSTTIWGGAFQVGYNYYFLPTWFLNVNYTYTLTGTYKFTVQAANPTVTWFNNPIPTASQWATATASYSLTNGNYYLTSILNTPSFNAGNVFSFNNLSVSRKIQLQAQEFMFSINKVFEL